MLFDVHCHLTDMYFSDKISSIVDECTDKNVSILISAGLNPIDNRKVLEISKKYKVVNASLGLYPLDAISMKEEEIIDEAEFIKKNKEDIIALSEVGLDMYYANEIKKQIWAFQNFIELSEKIGKPLIVHSRKAEAEVIEMLESSNVKSAVLHSFGGNKNLIKRAIYNKFYFSIPPLAIRSSNFQTLVDLAPLNLLLTESDSPYQSPTKNQRNFPFNVVESLKIISKIKKLDEIETENILFMNFQKIFKKWKTI